MKRDDFYTSEFRAGIQRSMAEPFRPLNVRQPKSYIPTPRLERRSKWLQRWWYAHNEDIGLICWSVVVFIGFVEVVLIYGLR